MKRAGHLMEKICHFENLEEAFLRAVKGKSRQHEVIMYRKNINERLRRLRTDLLTGAMDWNNYHFFKIYDPKERLISAVPFNTRVAFHAIMRICHPVFDDYQHDDSYASRKGRGVDKALNRCHFYSRRYHYFAKLDMVKYFDSIDHEIMKSQLHRLFKDRLLISHFERIIDSYEASAGKGLPIGNLTSQYFANHYLASTDHYAKQELNVKGLVRYMDDVLLFDNDKDELKRKVKSYCIRVKSELLLSVHEPIINSVVRGIPIVGYVARPSSIHVNRRSRHRFIKKMKSLGDAVSIGIISQEEYSMRAQCMLAFVNRADSEGFLRSANMKIKGLYPQGL